jgi:hypothetical protein
VKRVLCLLLLAASAYAQKRNYIPSGWPWDTLPHVVDGLSWSTSIIMTNLQKSPARYKLDFFDNNGNAVVIEFLRVGRAASYSGVIPTNGSVVIATPGTSTSLLQGWAQLDSLATDRVGIMAVFTQRIAGRPDYEATVPASTAVEFDSVMPFDNTNGFVTGVVLLNPTETGSITTTVTIFDESGTSLRTETITLGARSKIVFPMPDRWPESRGRRGTISIDSIPTSISILGLRFHPGGSFTTVIGMDR